MCVCVHACGGGVLAGVEQSCNEQILEREGERARPKERTDDLVELRHNNNPDFSKRWDAEDKAEERNNLYFLLLLFSSSWRGERLIFQSAASREERYSLS